MDDTTPHDAVAYIAITGPCIDYRISELPNGGYVLAVDGAPYCARSTLHEAIAAMGNVAARRWRQTAPPHQEYAERLAEDDPSLDMAAGVAAPYGPRRQEGRRTQAPVQRAMRAMVLALAIVGVAMWKGAAA